ncbi:hypothetical protein NESM_000736000 [Novymonas esmeraldas]|uniref:Uncharacterized protein n=1 Tax=Novymonas esmeraldas TaxID=1808958 RepID=A0AAW0EUS1_9TRYP
MFDGCLQHCLEFVGVQPHHTGCTAAQLSEFICVDLLPFQGWAANPTLRDTIVRLLVVTHAAEVEVYTTAPPQDAQDAQDARGKANPPVRRRGGRAAGVPCPSRTDPPARRHVAPGEAVLLLDAGRVAWVEGDGGGGSGGAASLTSSVASKPPLPSSLSASPPEQQTHGGGDGGVVLFFVPSTDLRQRTLGFPIQNEKETMLASFVVESALLGWQRLPGTQEFKARYKTHLLTSGLAWLRQTQRVSTVYTYDEASRSVAYRYFPHFALPLTECEKREEQRDGDGGDGEDELHVYGEWGHASGAGRAPSAAMLSAPSSPLRRCSSGRRHYPLHHFFARQRSRAAGFPAGVFDLQLVRCVIQQSPERRLLLQDAAHAILAAHDFFRARWEELARCERMHMRQLMGAAGLRIVAASVSLRGYTRQVQLVIPAEDLAWKVPVAALLSAHAPAERSGGESEDIAERGGSEEGNEEDTGDGDSDGTNDGGERSGTEDEDAVAATAEATQGVSHFSTHQEQHEAVAVLRADANHPLELQAAFEAERRPFSLTAAVPRLRLQVSSKHRRKGLGHFLERYASTRSTLTTRYVLLRNSKVFTLVYAPREAKCESPPTAADGDATTVPEVMPDSSPSGATVSTLPAAATPPPPRTLRFAAADVRLPKGLSAYAVNVVLDVLTQAAPHHAASMPQLARRIDMTTLNRRIVPFLRQIGYVHTTAVAQRGHRHVGLVVLLPVDGETRSGTLSDAAKQAVLAAEAASTREEARLQSLQSIARGRAIQSDMVLRSVPAVPDDAPRSTFGERLQEVHPLTTKVVNRIMAMRNGYAQDVVHRSSRLHLELWSQHYRYPASGDGGARVRDVLARMSFSTFVIVVGLTQVDVGHVLNRADGVYEWSTPLSELPPSVYGWCTQAGAHMVAACLQELHTRRLLHLLLSAGHGESRNFLATAGDWETATYTLAPQCTTDGYTHHFIAAAPPPPTAAATLYACLRYWLPLWSARRRSPRRAAAQLFTAPANVGVAQVVALSKVLRQDPGTLAAQIYQSLEPTREPRRSADGDIGSSAAANATERVTAGRRSRGGRASSSSSSSPPSATPTGWVGRGGRAEGDAEGRHARHRWQRKTSRVDLGGPTVSAALDSALHNFAPLKRVEEVLQHVLRSRGVQLQQHPLYCVPAALPRWHSGVGGGVGGGTAATSSEFALAGAGQGGPVYNRLLNTTTTHMAGLAETLRAVRHAHAAEGGGPPRLRRSFAEALREEVESVYAPQAAAAASAATAAGGAAEVPAGTPSPSAPSPLPAARPVASTRTRATPSAESIFEVVTDLLRMIVLSDQAHYRASIARSLLTALAAPRLVARARACLQRLPSFRRGRRLHSRVPQLSLAPSPYVLPLGALRVAPRPCANLAALHQLAQEADAAACAAVGGRESASLQSAHATLCSLLHGVASPSPPPPPLQVLHQPSVEQASLAMPPNAVRRVMTQLPLPRLAWPAEAVAWERLRRPPPGTAEGRGATASARRGRKRGRTSAAERDEAEPPRVGASAAADRESDGDSDDAGGGGGGGGAAAARAEAETARLLYPARSILHVSDTPYLQDMPTDGTPTAEEQRAVEACRVAFSTAAATAAAPQSPMWPHHADGEGVPLRYPSIFHHVDGSWHTYMWHLVVHTVYRYILRVPGIHHAELQARVLASGVVSGRALLAVLHFLLDRRLLRCREECLAGPPAPTGDADAARRRSPFHSRKRHRHDDDGDDGCVLKSQELRGDPWRGTAYGNCSYHPTVPLEGLRLVLSPQLLQIAPS